MRNQIIDDIKRIYNENGKITRELYLEKGKFPRYQIKKHLGTWNEALVICELEVIMPKNLSKEELISKYYELENKYGEISAILYRREGYSQAAVDRIFGSWLNMMNELGKTSMQMTKLYSDEDLLDKLTDLYKEHGYVNSTLIELKSNIPIQTYINRFGSMTEIYKRLDIDVDNLKNVYFHKASYVIGVVSKILNENPLIEWTNDNLRNPETNMKLRVDAYFEKNKIAIEYDGEQHFKYIPFLHHNDKDKFIRQGKLDSIKEQYLIDNNITLIRFAYNEKLTVESITEKVLTIIKNQ